RTPLLRQVWGLDDRRDAAEPADGRREEAGVEEVGVEDVYPALADDAGEAEGGSEMARLSQAEGDDLDVARDVGPDLPGNFGGANQPRLELASVEPAQQGDDMLLRAPAGKGVGEIEHRRPLHDACCLSMAAPAGTALCM